ncbi:MAG: preprotein translocase subunit SecY [Planctomycetota bacterium]|nr:MAG: preprotein translocase subunit SecY [Planctomycetota bacterium]
MWETFSNIFKIPELRRKIIVTFALLIVYRIGFFIPIPGVDPRRIADILQQSGNMGGFFDVLAFASALTGGALAKSTLFALGIMPYISASIMFQLLVKVVPSLEKLSKEGASGRQKISQYTRYATVALCVLQSIFIVKWVVQIGIVNPFQATFGFYFVAVLTLTTGTMFVMWLGEQISAYGVGNGVSLIIMAGIIASMPAALFNFFTTKVRQADPTQVPLEMTKLVIILLLFVIVTVAVVIMQQASRRIPIQQQKMTRGRKVYGGSRHYMPLKLNPGGVLPVIFAQALLILPTAILAGLGWDTLRRYINMNSPGFWYITIYCFLIGFFTYFWTSLMFNPTEMADQMKEHGSFIPGIRPGKRTADYLEKVMNRLTFVGSIYLALIAIFPLIVSSVMGVSLFLAAFLGGTGILIVVGVALDLVQRVESYLLQRHYEGFISRDKRVAGK